MRFLLLYKQTEGCRKSIYTQARNMALACALKAIFDRYKPHLSMIIVQILSAIVYFITEAAFNQGLNPYVYVTYRFRLAGLAMVPLAYVLGRKSRPKLTLALFVELFLVSFIGFALTFSMFFASMGCTSSTFVPSVFNTVLLAYVLERKALLHTAVKMFVVALLLSFVAAARPQDHSGVPSIGCNGQGYTPVPGCPSPSPSPN